MTRRFRQEPAAVFRTLTDGVVVLSLIEPDDEPLFLAGPGGDLWAALATPHTLDELAIELSSRYGQPPERIAADIAPVLEDLLAASILVVEPAEPAEPAEP